MSNDQEAILMILKRSRDPSVQQGEIERILAKYNRDTQIVEDALVDLVRTGRVGMDMSQGFYIK